MEGQALVEILAYHMGIKYRYMIGSILGTIEGYAVGLI